MNPVLAALMAAATPDLARWLRANEVQALRAIARIAEPRQRRPPRNVGKTKAWTKSEQKKAWDAIDGWRITYHPSLSKSKLLEKTTAADIVAIALSHLSGLRDLYAQRGQDNRKTARHFEANPSLYGKSTPEMIARFDGYAAKEEKRVAVFDKLIARIEAEGIPPKPDGWEY